MSALRICEWTWMVLAAVWLVLGFRRKETKERETGLTRLLYTLPTIVAFYLLFSSGSPYDWLHRRFVPSDLLVDVLGISITVLGIGFAIWARFYIGENWSGTVTVKVGHELVRTGPYSWVRHPIYSGLLLATLGTALALGEIRGALAVPVLWLGFWFKTRIEERFMLKTFGAAYSDYSRSTGGLIPKLLKG